MDTANKIKKLQEAVEEARTLFGLNADDIKFILWKQATEKLLSRIFGKESHEYYEVEQRIFRAFNLGPRTVHMQEESEKAYTIDLHMTIASLQGYIEDLQEQPSNKVSTLQVNILNNELLALKRPNKVFISHAGLDVAVVTELILLLRALGLQNEQIFCTSVPGYKIRLGTRNFLDAIKDEIRSGAVVIFLLSKNFYDSPVCLAEMGAAWVLDSDMIPLVLPPFEFRDVKGVIPFTQGMMVGGTRLS